MRDRREEIFNNKWENRKAGESYTELVKDAMDEYADERCIELLKWIFSNERLIEYFDEKTLLEKFKQQITITSNKQNTQ